jgi:glycosyltransferase involved in cell wall biosynthesis
MAEVSDPPPAVQDRVSLLPMAEAFDIVHLAFTTFPADTRVKREALAAASVNGRVAVIAHRGPDQPSEEDVGPLRVVRLDGRKTRGGPFAYVSQYVSFVWRCRRLLGRDPRFRNVRIVHVHTLPDFLVWAATPARRRGARIILDLHEIFPEFTASKYPGLTGRLAMRLARVLELDARRRADVTITVNRPIEALISGRDIGRTERVVLIHNSADPTDFGPPRRPERSERPGRLQLVYHGTLTPLYGVDIAVRGVALAASRGAPVHFTILGDGPERHALARLVGELGADLVVTFEAPIPQRALRDRLSRADAGIVPTRLDGMTRYSLSNKLLEYVHLGMPVLAARLPSYANYLGEHSAWYWTPGDPEDLARAIGHLAAAPIEERSARAERAQHNLEAIAWPHERARLVAVYRELLGKP